MRSSYEKRLEPKNMRDFQAFQGGFDEYGESDADKEVYKKYTDAIQATKRDFENYKKNLAQIDLELISVIESKLERINDLKVDLLKAKFQVKLLIFWIRDLRV